MNFLIHITLSCFLRRKFNPMNSFVHCHDQDVPLFFFPIIICNIPRCDSIHVLSLARCITLAWSLMICLTGFCRINHCQTVLVVAPVVHVLWRYVLIFLCWLRFVIMMIDRQQRNGRLQVYCNSSLARCSDIYVVTRMTEINPFSIEIAGGGR